MKKLFIIAMIAGFMGTACSTQRVYLKKNAEINKPTYEKSQPFFFWGLVGQPQVQDVSQACPGKTPVAVETHMTFVDGLLGSLTAGIYSPFSVRVYCQ